MQPSVQSGRLVVDYSGKVAVVTGAGSGLGAALARRLGGCRLALLDIQPDGLTALSRELPNAKPYAVDVASQSALDEVAASVEAEYGRVDLLINNAGISISQSFAETEAAQFDRLMEVNFGGVVRCCRAFLPLLRKGRPSQILNVSSCFAWVGYPGKSAYAASKAAIRAFSESLRIELAPEGIGVTVLYPGPLATNIVAAGVSADEEQRAKEEAFLRKRGLDHDAVARKALSRLAANPQRIIVGQDYRALDLMARLSPSLAERVVTRTWQRLGF